MHAFVPAMSYEELVLLCGLIFQRVNSGKNIFLQYSLEGAKGTHRFKASYTTIRHQWQTQYRSRKFALLFPVRLPSTLSLHPVSWGLSYIYNTMITFFANQGVFAENKTVTMATRRLSRLCHSVAVGYMILSITRTGDIPHVGATFRYAQCCYPGTVENNVLKTELNISSSLEALIKAPLRTSWPAQLPWAKNVSDVGAEFLYKTGNFFTRGSI